MRGEKITRDRSHKKPEGAHESDSTCDAAPRRAAREATNLLTATPDEAAILIDAW